MKNKNNKLVSYFFIVLLVALISTEFLTPLKEKRMLEEYFVVTGQFTQIGKYGVGANVISKYKYVLNNNEIIGETFVTPCKNYHFEAPSFKEDFINVRFPVAISKLDSSFSVPLLTREDFEIIEKRLPDSLESINQKYFDCTFIQSLLGPDLARHFYK